MTSYREYQKVLKLTMREPHATVTPPASSPEASPTLAPQNCGPERRKKITRTKTGCFCCRRRKKKCDEKKPACSGCVRNMLTCVYPDKDEIARCKRKRKPQSQEHVPFLPLSPLSSPTIREREYTMERTRPTPTSDIPEVALTPKWRPSTGISIKSLLN
ncbi:hypothetical protein KL920_002937 [Ogataea angusta]|uniref:Zn(2)-C6 fungal-type domain-containing protein n=1 Tax=Pichia angusta TaxID=870730 RepID=A0ABQ7RTP3_PICAN|nr:hypothetical protein KL920_002937 [Ogataea angusta]KAG7834056.1 hypothetical protein KL943_003352 [Ogataea angusta]KAG7847385.1 hypothetical protein KL940_003721 [Ogataea angusta]